jgi:hypothetical protein
MNEWCKIAGTKKGKLEGNIGLFILFLSLLEIFDEGRKGEFLQGKFNKLPLVKFINGKRCFM